MSDENIFGDKSKVEDGSSTPSSNEVLGTLLAGITNEQGEQKYSDISKALEALASSQTYIPELHTKMDAKDATIAELREKLTKTEAIDDVLQRLQANQQEPAENQPRGLDAGEAAKLFADLQTKSDAEKARASNTATVTSKLKEKFGDNAEKEFYDKGKELGLSPTDLNNLAGTSPAAVLALFGETSKSNHLDVSQGSQALDVSPQELGTPQGRNNGKSVLSGSTAKDVRAEFDIVKARVKAMHEEGISVESRTDPKEYRKHYL